MSFSMNTLKSSPTGVNMIGAGETKKSSGVGSKARTCMQCGSSKWTPKQSVPCGDSAVINGVATGVWFSPTVKHLL